MEIVEKEKMKTKIVVLVGLALCIMLLVSPALASDAGTLGIYGNANEDDTIDMRDLTYVKLIFFGKKPETELSDAKYDGKINPLDFIQIKLIIVGKEKELTVVDTIDRIVTVKKPVKRIATFWPYSADVTRLLGEHDKLVIVSSSIKKRPVYFPELSKLPSISRPYDCEAILSLNPDLAITYRSDVLTHHLDEKLPGVSVVTLEFLNEWDIKEEIQKLGYILGKEERAKEYIDDFYDKYISFIRTQTEELSEEEKPKVYVEYWKPYHTYGSKGSGHSIIEVAGGKNIFADIPEYTATVDPEEVLARNPDIITRRAYASATKTGKISYEADTPSDLQALRDEIMSRPELANVNAVKNKRVYIADGYLMTSIHQPIGIVYYAKFCQPELFEDLDPETIHHEYLDRFCSLDYDLDEHGVFMYPPIEVDGNLAGIPDRYKGQIE